MMQPSILGRLIMSNQKNAAPAPQRVVLVIGSETPSPVFRYQRYSGKSGHLSAKQAQGSAGKIPALQNFTV